MGLAAAMYAAYAPLDAWVATRTWYVEPLAPAAAAFHVNVNGASQGPYTVEQVAQGIASGSVAAATMVWCTGMPQWLAAAQVPQLAGLFGPPPAPPGIPPATPGSPPPLG